MSTNEKRRVASAKGSISERRLKTGEKRYTLRMMVPGPDGLHGAWKRKARTFHTKSEAEECQRSLKKTREPLIRGTETRRVAFSRFEARRLMCLHFVISYLLKVMD